MRSGLKDRGRSTAAWHADTMDTVGTGITIVGNGLDGHLEAETGVDSTGFLTSLLGIGVGSEIPALSHVLAPAPCWSVLFLGGDRRVVSRPRTVSVDLMRPLSWHHLWRVVCPPFWGDVFP